MSVPTDLLATIEQVLNRLSAEAVLAQVGRDDGLIPAYSLLGELREHCSLESTLREPVVATQAALEKRLDAAQPFDEESLRRLRTLVEWMPDALEAIQSGRAAPPFGDAAGAPPQPEAKAQPAIATDAAQSADELLTLNLDESRELLAEFHAEAVDHLAQIEAALLALEQRPDDAEAINSIFRSFHTIKGNAGFLGLAPMHRLAHEVESLLDLARNHKLVLNSAIITEILRSRDALVMLTEQVSLALEKGAVPDRVVPVAHLIAAVKELAATGGVGTGTAATRVAPVAAPAPAKPEVSSAAASGVPRSGGTAQTVRVNTEKLDSLMNVVGELVIVQSQLIESARGLGDGGSPLQRNIGQLSRITKELQTTAMALRMIPVKPIFQKMERLVRDLARDCGKQVTLATSGEDTEIDRTVVEEIGDPLVHMVRNAIDHGVEPPADRRACGKPETGQLQLRAYHRGSNIVIELADDGRGLDPAKLLAKARAKGLVPENTQPSREEIYNVIFLPGFSTAEKVTAVSGRGVGMDVVRRNIEKLRGKVEIESEVGRGSVFRIKLPLTMAIIDGLVVRVGTDRFILPTTSVQVALKPTREAISTVQGRGEVIDLRGRVLPLHRLNRCFNIPADAENPWDGIVVVVEASGRTSALLVDEMISKQEVVIKNFSSLLQSAPGVAGGAIMGDGNIALILDPALLRHAA
ncbi:MAG TPA: chemotaxis protein CheA [Opitutus sp.]|nr:chemotaxis protein CheA [Opitutus sp.]